VPLAAPARPIDCRMSRLSSMVPVMGIQSEAIASSISRILQLA